MKITFLGATRMVTGSCYLLEIGSKKMLLDCGMFQGSKTVSYTHLTLPTILLV